MQVPNLAHNDFVSFCGALRPMHIPELPSRYGDDVPEAEMRGKIRASYELVVDYTRNFLDATLRGVDRSERLDNATAGMADASHKRLPPAHASVSVQALTRVLLARGVDAAHAQCKAADCKGWVFGSMAQALTAAGRHEEAEAAFRLHRERFPDDWWLCGEHADTLGRLGRIEEARATYEKARELLARDKKLTDEARARRDKRFVGYIEALARR